MSCGILYGVGVGPGAVDLLTFRAVRVLRRAKVVVLPRSSHYGQSTAWRIVKSILRKSPAQEHLFLTFPMSREPARHVEAWEKAFAQIGPRLEEGLSVAFATEGDPSLYSTFIYLQREAKLRWPGIEVQVVPGVSSIAAVPAVTGIPLADGLERVAIIPAGYGVKDLVDVLEQFDTTVLMKIGSEMSNIFKALELTGLTNKAVYVSKATMDEQRIVRDVREMTPARGDCFAMIVVSRKERSGVLAGEIAPDKLLSQVTT
jgi:precorrin-2/cobalt-factor-2 C20-methyltransferase